MILETERYILREFEVSEAKDMYLLNLDSEVLKYTGDLAFTSIVEALQFLIDYKSLSIIWFEEMGCGKQNDRVFYWLVWTEIFAPYDGI